jgi:hypothetical protein
MKTKTKFIASCIASVLAAIAFKLTAPAASLAANSTVVKQLESSNAASLSNTMVGNGQWLPAIIIYVILMIAFFIIWTMRD